MLTILGRSPLPEPTPGSSGGARLARRSRPGAARARRRRWPPSSTRRGGLGGIALTHDHHDHAGAVPLIRERFPAGAAGSGPRRRRRPAGRTAIASGPLEAVATPGHAPDHLAFVAGTRALTGDAVLGEGSVFIAPDPGALCRLPRRPAQACRRRPGGPAARATGRRWPTRQAKLDEYIDHRLDRERRLLAALDAGARSVAEMLDAAWGDVPQLLRPAAAVTLAAHLDKLDARAGCPTACSAPTDVSGVRPSRERLRRRAPGAGAVARPADARAVHRRCQRRMPAASARSKISRSVSPIPRTRRRATAGVVAADLLGDVDQAAGIGDEVRRPEDPARAEPRRRCARRRAGCWPRPRSPGSAAAATVVVVEQAAERARDEHVDGGRPAPRSGVVQLAPSWSASARLRSSTSATSSRAPARAQRLATREPTCPSPSTQMLRPRSEPSPNARSQAARIAASTPRAVNGLGSPEPPRLRASPATCAVRCGDHAHVAAGGAHVLGGDVAALSDSHRSAKSSRAARRRRADSEPARRSHDHALAAAQRQVGHRRLERHRP